MATRQPLIVGNKTRMKMNINEMSESKYLKKEDCTPPMTLTISGLSKENLARDGEPPEMRWILQFSEAVKPCVLNMTNIRMIAHVTGSEETNDWIGKKITLWNDPTVSFNGNVGGIRVQSQVSQDKPQISAAEEMAAEARNNAPF